MTTVCRRQLNKLLFIYILNITSFASFFFYCARPCYLNLRQNLLYNPRSNSATTEQIIPDMSSAAAKTTSAEKRDGLIRMIHQEREKSASN